MGQNLNQIMWGEGVAFVNGKEAFDIQELSFNFGVEVLEALKGDGGGNIRIPTNQPITGRCGFLGLNDGLFSTLTGSTTATGTVKRIRSESLTKSTNDVTLSQSTVIENTLRVVPDGTNKQPLVKVDSSPAVGQYTISSGVITLNASQTETVFNCSYLYTDSANGETSRFGPNSLPSSFELYGSLRTKELFGDTTGDIIIKAAKCERVSEFTVGGQNGAISTPGFDINARVDALGDVEIYWP